MINEFSYETQEKEAIELHKNIKEVRYLKKSIILGIDKLEVFAGTCELSYDEGVDLNQLHSAEFHERFLQHNVRVQQKHKSGRSKQGLIITHAYFYVTFVKNNEIKREQISTEWIDNGNIIEFIKDYSKLLLELNSNKEYIEDPFDIGNFLYTV